MAEASVLQVTTVAKAALAVFEHGGLSADTSTACIEHCHIHVIDGAHDLRCRFELEFPEAEGAAISEEGAFTADSESGYLFTGIYRGDRAIRGLLVHAPGCDSQFFRLSSVCRCRALSGIGESGHHCLWDF